MATLDERVAALEDRLAQAGDLENEAEGIEGREGREGNTSTVSVTGEARNFGDYEVNKEGEVKLASPEEIDLPCGRVFCESGNLMFEDNTTHTKHLLADPAGETGLIPEARKITPETLARAIKATYAPVNSFGIAKEVETARHWFGLERTNSTGEKTVDHSEPVNLLTLLEHVDNNFSGLITLKIVAQIKENAGGNWTGKIRLNLKHNETTIGKVEVTSANEQPIVTLRATCLIIPGDRLELWEFYEAGALKEPWLGSVSGQEPCVTIISSSPQL